jgi:hypothetical protein
VAPTATRCSTAATADVRKLNNEGVILAHKGDFQGAIDRMLVACREAPFNPRILMNGIWVIMKCLEQSGMDHDLLDEAIGACSPKSKSRPRDTPASPGCAIRSKRLKTALAFAPGEPPDEIRYHGHVRRADA